MHIHAHSHHHHAGESIWAANQPDSATGRAFLLGIGLNAGFVVAEFAVGVVYNSMGLLADAGHNLGDVGGLAISLAAFGLARKRRAVNYTYGFRKATVLASLANAMILLLAVGAIMLECVRKFMHPEPVGGWPIIITAGVGIVINALTMMLFNRGRHRDLNVKGAYLHMLADTLVSVGVVVAGGLILWTGWSVLDPIVGMVIGLVILASTWGLLRESVRLSLDGVPNGIELEELLGHMRRMEHVQDVHHVHVWPISTTENALTAHVIVNDFSALESVKKSMRAELAEHGVTHSTLEFELPGCGCQDRGI